MIALVILALMAGAALGVILAGMLAAGRREDDCRACRRRELDAAFRAADGADEYIWGTEQMTKYARLTSPHDPEWRDRTE